METMEFNILPKAKLLSPHLRNKSNQNNSQTVNVILPNANHEISERSEKSEVNPYQNISRSSATLEPEEIKYNDIKSRDGIATSGIREVNLEQPAEQLTKEDSISTINFLKLVLQSYMNNPIKFNGYVICSVPTLENLIETLTGCEDCEVEFADNESGCCGGSIINHIIPITKIWVQINGSREIFKYKFSQYLQVFDEYHISLKFVYVD